MNKKIALISLLVTIVIIGGYFFPRIGKFGATNNAVGTVYNTAKIAQINWSLTAGATSTSVLNSDSYDRIVTSFVADCNTTGTSKIPLTGTGLASLFIQAATTSASAPAVITNTNLLAYSTVSTSTPDFYIASSTIGVADFGRVWLSGSYLTFWSNATNTAVCTVGVNYIGF